MKLNWAEWKAFVDLWGLRNNVRYTPKDASGVYNRIWVSCEGVLVEYNGSLSGDDPEFFAEFEGGYLKVA
jgi:hypothetical protein